MKREGFGIIVTTIPFHPTFLQAPVVTSAAGSLLFVSSRLYSNMEIEE